MKFAKVKIHIIIFFFLFFYMGNLEIQSQDMSKPENIKAVFIYNFTLFLEWPELSDSTFKIGVIGESNIFKALEEVAEHKTIDGKKIEIVKIDKIKEPLAVQMLYITEVFLEDLHSILERVKNKSILTISNTPDFGKLGVAINFITIDGKLRFEINRKALTESGIKTDTRLLRLGILL